MISPRDRDKFEQDHSGGRADCFPATRWSMVLAARDGSTTVGRKALAELCRTYWFPLYAFARRRGLPPEDAEDATQDFFQRLLARGTLESIEKDRGKLRAFLLTLMRNHLTSGYRRKSAEKRGSGSELLSIDIPRAESCLAGEPSHGVSPDVLFDRNWACALLDSARQKLAGWYEGMGKPDLFAALQPFLGGHDGSEVLREVATRLGVSETALRSAIHHMRKRYRSLIEDEIRETVATKREAEEEIAHLRSVLAGE